MKNKLRLTFLAPLVGLSLPAILWAATLDLDNDGMSDAWQLLHNASDLEPGDDEDGDKVTNLAESQAGTDPHDPDSYFHVADYQLSPDGVTVCYDTVLGKEYQIVSSSDMSSWTPSGIWQKGTGSRVDVAVSSSLRQFTPGSVTREWYDLDGLPGWGLSRLRSAPSYLAETPEETYNLTEARFIQFTPDRNNHGSRIRAYLIPPTTGEYTFHIATDDHSELMLSTDADPANKTVIASISSWTNQNEWDKFPEQHSAPITLNAGEIYYLELEHHEGGGGDHGAIAWDGPGILFQIIPGEYLAPYDSSAPTFIPDAQAFFRVLVRDPDSDGDGSSDYDELVLNTNPESPASGSLSELSTALADTNRLSISTLDPAAYESSTNPGRFIIRREGNLNALTAHISASGTAGPADYFPIPTTVAFPLGSREAIVPVNPWDDGLLENEEDVTVTLMPHTSYDISGSGSASLLIEDSPPSLLLSRPAPPAGTSSIAQALVTYWEKGNRSSARLSIEYSNLASEHTGTTIAIESVDGLTLTPMLDLPAGQTLDYFWDYGADASTISAALDDDRLLAIVKTTAAPDGELIAPITTQGEDVANFNTPADPPSLPGGAITDEDAARFLSQTTFGPNTNSIANLVSVNSFETWIDNQMNEALTPPTLHYPPLLAMDTEEFTPGRNERQDQWFKTILYSDDQLRQRVAFALSQIFVVSDEDGTLNGNQMALANYYDMLVSQAFGNYRTLLEDISKSPIMGAYLSHLRNRKADPYLGTNPDENYAREIMQLFSIGLVMLHPDGSPQLGPDGVPIPTYNQTTISELARVFTGWSFYTEDIENTSFRYGSRDYINSMVNFPEYHDQDPKSVVAGLQLPGDQTAEVELDAVLDTLFNHQNTGPFISRLLIQRLVTANPSPGYIYRVASVFDDDGTGTRGNLGAVVKAVLLDYEARSSTLTPLAGYGKPQEPLLKFVRALRIFGHTNANDVYRLRNENNNFAQAPLRAPTVFNFYLPDYSPPGTLAEAGLLAPEFQIIAETTIVSGNNRIWDALDFDGLFGYDSEIQFNFDWQPYITMYLNDPADYVDFLDLHFLSGQMTTAMRTELLDLLANMTWWNATDTDLYRVSAAAQLVANSAQASVLK